MNLPMDQKIIMLILIVIVIAISNDDLSNLPYIMVGVLAVFAGRTVIHGYDINPHTCREPLQITSEPLVGNDMKSDPSPQDKDVEPIYKNIKIHDESHQAKSYPTTHLSPSPLQTDQSITNYPFKLIDDKDGKVHPIYTQDDPSDEITSYAEDPDILKMYKSQSYNGDNMIADRMKYLSDKPKQAIIARANMDKYTIAPFLEEELEQHANSRWWENNQDLEHVF